MVPPPAPMGASGAVEFPAMVTWTSAIHFCNWPSEQEKLPAFYQIDEEESVTSLFNEGYHLPTEAVWEFACRSGSEDGISTKGTETAIEDYAWTLDSEGGEAPVESIGQKMPNAFGLHDNVAEWCYDFFRHDACTNTAVDDP